MSKSNVFENELLLLLYNNSNIANIGDATGVRGSTAAGSFYFALHSADPGEAGDQTTNELAYTGYARVAKARSGAGFTVSGNSCSPATDTDFTIAPAATNVTATHFSVGVAAAGASKIIHRGALTPNITITEGVIPRVGAGTTITED